MPIAGIKVLIVGQPIPLPYECKRIQDPAAILFSIAQFQPDVIVTSNFIPGVLNGASFEVRKRWVHLPNGTKIQDAIRVVENCYSFNLWNDNENSAFNPLISVYTPTYNTGDYLRETYQSLRDQSYKTWEWVVVDDHSSDGTWERLTQLAKEDVRVRPFQSGKRLEKIGAVKDLATRLSKGTYLVELDHDDMLTDFALDEIKKAFESDPEIGFVYSNSSDFFEDGSFRMFNDDFWKNRYRKTMYRGKEWTECICPDIYDRFGSDFKQQFGYFLTVGPNHVRAFRAKTLFELGGYNPSLPVADDWDLFSRFFLRSKCYWIDKMLYLYRIKDAYTNATFTRNKSIQDHLELGRIHRAPEFKAFNDKRLTIGRDKDEILLTVVVPSIPSRMESMSLIVKELFRQAEGKPVEVICLLDNRKSNLSEKRNQAISNAKGRFITFVDDDDKVEEDYVESILEAIRGNPEAHCIVFDVMVHGYTETPKLCRYGIEYSHGENEASYLRKPNHVMAYRTSISKRHQYRKDLSAINEDTEWADRASREIKRQARVEKVLYHYFYNEKETTQIRAVPGQRTLKDVSFIVLEAAPTPLTERCMESIRKHAPGAEIIFVDNGVGNKEIAKKADKTVSFDINLGFAAGCNAGSQVTDRPILCFMNNDAAFVDETPAKLLAALSDETPIVGPFSNRAKPPQGDISRETVPAQDVFPEMVVGLCLMIPKSLYDDLGGFDPDLLTYEDDYLCLKAREKGFRPKVVGGTWVDHERHETFKKLGMDVNDVMASSAAIYQRKKPVIRVIVIARDEEKSLEGFFTQFKDVTREWCVLDTGSKDSTVFLARKLGCRVEVAPFVDFASARNEAVRRFGGGADWIIMLDPDERLDEHTIQHMTELFFRSSDDIFYAPLQAKYPDGTVRTFVSKPFAWRNKPDILWTFKVHEKLIGSKRQALVVNGMITHLIELHDDGRREAASSFYSDLMKAELYFTDREYKKKMIEEWPILDYDRMDDPRIKKIHAGPLISVVIPTYKRIELLNRALASALKQDYQNLEIIVVGDSCPELDEILQLGKTNPRIKIYNLIHNHGAGGAVPRNHAIAAAGGLLVAYLDDDNMWMPDHLSSLYKVLKDANASYAFSSMQVDGVDLGFSEPKQGGIDTSCILHYKKLVPKYGGWRDRTEASYYHDWEFVSRWVNGKEPWAATRKPTLVYNADTCGQKEFLKGLVASKKEELNKTC